MPPLRETLETLGLKADWQTVCAPLGCYADILNPLHQCAPTGAWAPAPIATICAGKMGGASVTGWKAFLLMLTVGILPIGLLFFGSTAPPAVAGGTWARVWISGTTASWAWRWLPALPGPP